MENEDQRQRRAKEELYQLFAQVASAIANPHRLELLDLLVQAPRTVEELAREAHMSVANTSHHLQRLKRARMVASEREGTYVRYRLATPAVTRVWLQLRDLAELQLAEVERAADAYRRQRHEFENITAEELFARLGDDEAVLLDVRPKEEFDAAHLPGAMSIPWSELEGRLGELPRDKKIVAYCRGPYCIYADDALQILTDHGWDVARLEEGVAEWERAGYALA